MSSDQNKQGRYSRSSHSSKAGRHSHSSKYSTVSLTIPEDSNSTAARPLLGGQSERSRHARPAFPQARGRRSAFVESGLASDDDQYASSKCCGQTTQRSVHPSVSSYIGRSTDSFNSGGETNGDQLGVPRQEDVNDLVRRYGPEVGQALAWEPFGGYEAAWRHYMNPMNVPPPSYESPSSFRYSSPTVTSISDITIYPTTALPSGETSSVNRRLDHSGSYYSPSISTPHHHVSRSDSVEPRLRRIDARDNLARYESRQHEYRRGTDRETAKVKIDMPDGLHVEITSKPKRCRKGRRSDTETVYWI